jgi:hypothetical protein
MYMDHTDFDMKPWDVDDPEPGRKNPMLVQDINILRKMYKLNRMLSVKAINKTKFKQLELWVRAGSPLPRLN